MELTYWLFRWQHLEIMGSIGLPELFKQQKGGGNGKSSFCCGFLIWKTGFDNRGTATLTSKGTDLADLYLIVAGVTVKNTRDVSMYDYQRNVNIF